MTAVPIRPSAEASPRSFLPMLHRTQGNRSAVTCHLKCADACSHPVPNTSDNAMFRDVAGVALTRRQTLGLAAAGAVTLVVGPSLVDAPPAAAASAAAGTTGWLWGGGSSLPFQPIAPVPTSRDAMTVPRGFTSNVIIRWGDPLFSGLGAFDPTTLSAAEQERRFGYNNDYLDIIQTGRKSALLVCNHEYTNENIMFPAGADPARVNEIKRIAIAAHGMSVVELSRDRSGRPWSYRVGARRNRRITAATPFAVTGRPPGRRCCGRWRIRRAPGRCWARWATAPAGRLRGGRCCPVRRNSTGISAARAPRTRTSGTGHGCRDVAGLGSH